MEQQRQYVGIDLHRRRSVIVRRSSEGETLEVTKVDNDDLLAFEQAVMAAGERPEVVLEACYGWYWATDLLDELGCKTVSYTHLDVYKRQPARRASTR